MYKQILLTLLIAFSLHASSQKVAYKTNLLYLATTTPNLAMEFSLSRKLTADIAGGYNPWDFSGNTSLRHWLVQPELRYWPCQSFEGHFFGLHGIYGKFNVGELSFIHSMNDYIYKGSMYGGGISYGYHFPLKGKWSLELTAGVGYVHLDYDKYTCRGCLELQGSYKRNYIGPTKAGVSIIYMIN
ncbi:uncharacterized protein DUF3575 [Dysgonomonas alginatilytica]|uniref:Uncharacterized protein DUF3575 n=1 Tax=Dysgonomonas alginatilytica TaxID=1605892 RepID=A0A2V3PL80_9BACT|nr:DUF3575 domain-containing protein [Dysgonomonas alginatilytica]PXV60098.1 uncharacterized protein DUF3575 [Dysgonomonas alginatilytica]